MKSCYLVLSLITGIASWLNRYPVLYPNRSQTFIQSFKDSSTPTSESLRPHHVIYTRQLNNLVLAETFYGCSLIISIPDSTIRVQLCLHHSSGLLSSRKSFIRFLPIISQCQYSLTNLG